jgi:putative tryptophan/tyrosine transport system substrate-binding protein
MDRLNRRRTLLGAVGAGLVAPGFLTSGFLTSGFLTYGLALAQAARVVTVAVLYAGDSDDDEPVVRPFFEEMARLGWTEGKNIVYDRSSGKGTRQYLSTMASQAAGREPDLIYATTTTLAAAVLKETDSLPVVFATAADPVAAGLVASLAKPGRNATGAFLVPEDGSAKRFALLRQAIPQLKRLGAVFDRGTQDYQSRKAAHEKSARAAGLELVSVEFTNFEAIAKILAQFKRDGLIAAEITPSFALIGRRREVASLAERNGIALVAHRVEWAEAGAVLTYGSDVGESHRRAAGLAHRILQGAKAAELPVERVQKFETAVNTRTAEALGLHLPQSILRGADKVFS